LGAKVFIRSKQGVELTRAGKHLLAGSNELLQKWEGLKRGAQDSEALVQGLVRLGCHASVARYTLGAFLPELLREHPALTVELRHDLSRKITDAVLKHELDLGIVVNPIPHPDLIIRKLGRDSVGFWTRGQKLSENSVILCDPELVQTQALLKKLKRFGVKRPRILASSSLEVIASLVDARAGIAILPARVARAGDPRKRMKLLTHTPRYQDEICLVLRVESRKISVVQEVVQRIVSSWNR
jgi:DNA-binding transcriptional LysR family regulator